jgi:hypothetical protein
VNDGLWLRAAGLWRRAAGSAVPVQNERVNLGITDSRVSSSGAAPAARRVATPGWRDPRLWIGVVIVAASMLAGALVLGTSDDTVPVWAAADSLGSGHVLNADDLAVRRVRFDDANAASLYFRADRQLPADLRLSRDVGAGELLPRAAVSAATQPDPRQVPVSVPPDQVPRTISVGDVVDVYLRPSSHTACAGSPVCAGQPVLAGVRVLDAPPPDDRFGSDGSRMLVVGVSGAQAQRFFRLLATTDDASLTVVGR